MVQNIQNVVKTFTVPRPVLLINTLRIRIEVSISMKDQYYFPKNKHKYIKRFSKILSTASYIPETSLSNEEIIERYKLPFKSSAILKTTGVARRHIANNNQDDSDLLCLAAQSCLERYGLKPDNLSRLIVNKYRGDNLLPMTASRLQAKLGSKTANHAFDVDGGISSFLIALDLATRYIDTGDDFILIASGGIHNRLVSKTDPRVAFLFGDASAAILLGPSTEPHVLASYFYTNHNFYELATSRGLLFLENISFEEDSSVFYDTYKMGNWKQAADFYQIATREIYRNLQEESGLSIEEMDLVLVTENNAAIRRLTLETLGVGEEKSLTLLAETGNTMSAMLPLLLDHAAKTGRLQEGTRLMLISHGEGISGGGMVYKV